MCGRFVTNFSMAELVDSLEAAELDVVRTADVHDFRNFNGAPTQLFPVVMGKTGDGGSSSVSVEIARWGLVPRWMKDDKSAARMINARVETVREKPSFKGLLSGHRCIVPMCGYYEWNRDNPKKKIPFFIFNGDSPVTFAAGLWTTSPVTGDVPTFTMLTEDAPNEVAFVHDRAPVLLDVDWMKEWLGDSDAPVEAVSSRQRHRLSARQVSERVNSVRNNDQSLVAEVQQSDGGAGLFDV